MCAYVSYQSCDFMISPRYEDKKKMSYEDKKKMKKDNDW